MAYEFQVTVDCADPHAMADWWAETLGWQVQPQDEAFIRRMISAGHAADRDTKLHNGTLVWKEGAAICHPDGTQRAPRVLFQLVPEAKVVKVLHSGHQGPHTWVTLADPEGNEFCVSQSASSRE